MKSFLSLSFLTILLSSCSTHRSSTQEQIAGSYARETSFEVRHPQSGKSIGRSTIRDTVFIKANEQGFEVRQTKWRLNDFDQRGWQNQQHAENRPVHPYQATFDPTDSLLQPITPGFGWTLFVDVNQGLLYPDKDGRRSYHRVK